MRQGRGAPPLRILNYAINGLGLGHLTRLIAISRQMRRLSSLLGRPAEILFLTSNEGDSLAYLEGFASFKIPSKTAAAACGMDPVWHRKIAKQWVWNAVNLISPEILVVDTFPMGSFHELFDVLDLGSKNAFIYRAVRPEAAAQPAFQSALRGYDRILMPLEQGENGSPVPVDLQDRIVPTREILIRSAAEVLDREAARETLGLPLDATPAVYLSVGGGGDASAEALFALLIEAARQMPEARFVVGAGALYRGREVYAPNVTWTRRPVMVECFRAFDAAVVAGGYNTVNELMHCGIPCAFLPQPRTHDDQERRVQRCVAAGAGILPDGCTPEAVAAALQRLLDPKTRRLASEAAARLVPVNDALTAAEEILSLVADRDPIEEAAALLVDPGFLPSLRRAGVPEEMFLAAVHFFARAAAQNGGDEAAILGATADCLTASHQLGVNPARALGALRKTVRTAGSADALLGAALDLLREEG